MSRTVSVKWSYNDTIAIKSKGYVPDGAGGFTETPVAVVSVPCSLQPITGGKELSAGQQVIDATHIALSDDDFLVVNGDLATSSDGTDYEVTYYEHPNFVTGGYHAVYLKEIRQHGT